MKFLFRPILAAGLALALLSGSVQVFAASYVWCEETKKLVQEGTCRNKNAQISNVTSSPEWILVGNSPGWWPRRLDINSIKQLGDQISYSIKFSEQESPRTVFVDCKSRYRLEVVVPADTSKPLQPIYEGTETAAEVNIACRKVPPAQTDTEQAEYKRKAAQLEEERKRIEEEKRQIALERQRMESQKAQTQVAPDNRRRLALVIGNDNYNSMPRLNNAVNDAKSMSEALRQANFEVMSYNNLDKRRMEEVLRNFTGKLGRDDVGLFYFSGHGIQADNRNFLIPVGENVKKTSEVPYEGVDVNRVMDNLKDAKNALNIVVLDACRSSLPDARGGMSRGLTVTDAPQGSIIAYATSPGKTASDGDSGNSPYTKNLIKAMQRKGFKIEDVFKEVRQSVIRDTNGEQTPSETSYLVGDFYFRP